MARVEAPFTPYQALTPGQLQAEEMGWGGAGYSGSQKGLQYIIEAMGGEGNLPSYFNEGQQYSVTGDYPNKLPDDFFEPTGNINRYPEWHKMLAESQPLWMQRGKIEPYLKGFTDILETEAGKATLPTGEPIPETLKNVAATAETLLPESREREKPYTQYLKGLFGASLKLDSLVGQAVDLMNRGDTKGYRKLLSEHPEAGVYLDKATGEWVSPTSRYLKAAVRSLATLGETETWSAENVKMGAQWALQYLYQAPQRLTRVPVTYNDDAYLISTSPWKEGLTGVPLTQGWIDAMGAGRHYPIEWFDVTKPWTVNLPNNTTIKANDYYEFKTLLRSDKIDPILPDMLEGFSMEPSRGINIWEPDKTKTQKFDTGAFYHFDGSRDGYVVTPDRFVEFVATSDPKGTDAQKRSYNQSLSALWQYYQAGQIDFATWEGFRTGEISAAAIYPMLSGAIDTKPREYYVETDAATWMQNHTGRPMSQAENLTASQQQYLKMATTWNNIREEIYRVYNELEAQGKSPTMPSDIGAMEELPPEYLSDPIIAMITGGTLNPKAYLDKLNRVRDYATKKQVTTEDRFNMNVTPEGWNTNPDRTVTTPNGFVFTPSGEIITPNGDLYLYDEVRNSKGLLTALTAEFSQADIDDLMKWTETHDLDTVRKALEEAELPPYEPYSLDRLKEVLDDGVTQVEEKELRNMFPNVSWDKVQDAFITFYRKTGGRPAWEQQSVEEMPKEERAFMTGAGTLVTALGSTAQYLEQKTGLTNLPGPTGAETMEFGRMMQEKYQVQPTGVFMDVLSEKIPWSEAVFDTRFWSDVSLSLTESLPITLAIMPAAYAIGMVGVPVGIGAVGTFLISSVVSGSAKRMIEATFEAGTIRATAEQMGGYTNEQLAVVYEQAFWDNMKLVGFDIALMGATYLPLRGVLSAAAKTGMLKPMMGVGAAGKIGVGMMAEGSTEYTQEVISDKALLMTGGLKPEDLKEPLTPARKAAAIIGGIYGGLFPGASIVFESVITRSVDKLSPESQEKVNKVVETEVSKGLTETQAKIVAMDTVVPPAETTKALTEALNEVKIEEMQKEAEAVGLVEGGVSDLKQWLAMTPEERNQELRESQEKSKGLQQEVTPVGETEVKGEYQPGEIYIDPITGQMKQVPLQTTGNAELDNYTLQNYNAKTSGNIALEQSTQQAIDEMKSTGRVSEGTARQVKSDARNTGRNIQQPSISQVEATKEELAEIDKKYNEYKAKIADSFKRRIHERGAINDPEARQLMDDTIEFAKLAIKKGVKTVEAFALEIGEDVNDFIRQAWEQAQGGTVPPQEVPKEGTEIPETGKEVPAEAITERKSLDYTDISDIKDRVNAVIKSATKARLEQWELRKPEYAKRFGEIKDIRETELEPIEAVKSATSKLYGEYPKGEWSELDELNFTPVEVQRLIGNAKINPKLSDAEFVQIGKIFQKLATFEEKGDILQKNEVDLLKKAYDIDLPKDTKIQRLILDIVNIQRSLLASFDHSMILRQTLLTAIAYPKMSAKYGWQSFTKSFKKLSSEELMTMVMKDSDYQVLVDHDMSFTEWGEQAKNLSKREESFSSSLASYIPWVAWSERMAANYLNLVRLHLGKNGLRTLTDLGIVETIGGEVTEGADKLRQWTHIVNAVTGRGELGALTGAQPLLNATLFSPKLQAARVQIPYYYAKSLVTAKDPASRYFAKQMTRMIGSAVAFGLTVLMLGKLAGGETEDDPRSTNFGKVKFGTTRLSPLGGFEQYIRLAARLITGETKTQTGHIIKLTDVNSSGWKELTRFEEMKFSPLLSIIRDIMNGENTIGEEIDYTPKGLGKEAWNRIVPMFIQDMVDAYVASGVFGTFLALPAFFGMSVQTYDDPTKTKQLSSWVAALTREEDMYQKLMREGEVTKANELNTKDPLLKMAYDDQYKEYFSTTRRALSSYEGRVNNLKSKYNKLKETKMDNAEAKETQLKYLETQMEEQSTNALKLIK